ncbi:MAG: hypothetical protein A2049_01510 [Elusimicrobia bacterium GWA2_62_23]|nr:MAG: hypothetical protein A2049_01510 [Elusimicrobia bacterium GWA2_62_23]OGR68550.1 MAG: hypothetical protein A2179_00475 [Elusimicrobia bacterium GWC2_63_65]
MKRTSALLLALALAACGKSSDKPATAKKGLPAPEIKIEKMLKGDLKELKGWEDLKGKAVVLEFWGTTCHPCITNIPHMNELTEKFKDKPVVFIQVSKESEEKVKEFLADHDMKANVAAGAVDAFKKFKIFGIPHAALIDKKGVFQGGLHPGRLKEETIEALLAGKEISGAEEQEDEEAKPGEASAAGEKSLAFFSVASAGAKPKLSYGDTEFQADAMTLDYIIETAMGAVHGVEFVDVPEDVKNRKLKVTARVARVEGADNERRLMELFASGMSGALPVNIRIARKEKKVWLLKRNGALKPGLAKTENFGGRSMSKDGKGATMDASGAELGDLANELEDWLGAPVLDETGLTGNYKYRVEVKELTAKAVNAELADKLGLKLVEARREVEIAEVRGIKNGAKKL